MSFFLQQPLLQLKWNNGDDNSQMLCHVTYWQLSLGLSPAAESSVFSSQHQEAMEESVFRGGFF